MSKIVFSGTSFRISFRGERSACIGVILSSPKKLVCGGSENYKNAANQQKWDEEEQRRQHYTGQRLRLFIHQGNSGE